VAATAKGDLADGVAGSVDKLKKDVRGAKKEGRRRWREVAENCKTSGHVKNPTSLRERGGVTRGSIERHSERSLPLNPTKGREGE